jgi:hypothetical protein
MASGRGGAAAAQREVGIGRPSLIDGERERDDGAYAGRGERERSQSADSFAR